MWKLSPIVKLAIAVVVLVVLILLFGPAACNAIRGRDAQIKVDNAQHGALLNSAVDALNTQAAVSQNTVASQEVSRENERNIRNAEGSNQRVDPRANAAGLSGLCRRASHRNDPACRVQQPNPR